MANTPEPVRLADYRPFPFDVKETHLHFDIGDGATTVVCDIAVERRGEASEPLRLNGADVVLERLAVDGRQLTDNEYAIDGETLTLFDVPDACQVQVATRIEPEKNSALEGLYKSGSMFCTQCEAEGFRKIVYYPDRPDVLSAFTTSITADAQRYPVLLANGNLIAERQDGGRRTVTWQDPFPKPSYLFALVAGDLEVLEDEFTTRAGRRVALRIYSEAHNIGQCGYAMATLKRAMRWDEQRFGREYDLDIFMIVAVETFNYGAMENKGLNIFNTAYVLATPDIATDAAYRRVEGVVAHEYFHNWSGNRVTCRDWFQLSLKEGFTVYRDAEFSADMNSPTVKRIEDVEFLRSIQFVEDGGPRSHPVRPESYLEINNFYTPTVYNKGAEVVHMLATIVGKERFRAGCDAYFARHDGQAATVEDFVAAMESTSGRSLPQFWHWYRQAGTPLLGVREERDGDVLALTIEQSCPPTPKQPQKEPFHIPVAFGLVDSGGQDLLGAEGAASGGIDVQTSATVENPNADGTLVAHLTAARTTIKLTGVPDDAQVSFLRGFSAPVRVRYPRSHAALRHLAAFDSDGFARWDAGQSLVSEAVLGSIGGATAAVGEVLALFEELRQRALQAADDGEEKALLAGMLTLPKESWLLELSPGEDILAIADARDRLADQIAEAFDWTPLVAANETPKPYQPSPAHIARRQIKHRALWYAMRHLDRNDPRQGAETLDDMLAQADNLSDRLAALQGLLGLRSLDDASKHSHLDAFHERWASEALVVDAWFAAQSGSPLFGTLGQVQALQEHAAFNGKNPNKIRALLLTFTSNVRNFHSADGAAYPWLAERVVDIDQDNPQAASRLAKTLADWPRFDAERGRRMRAALATVGEGARSNDVREVVEQGLDVAPKNH